MKIRIKFGKNPYSNEFTCSYCGSRFSKSGFFIRIEYTGKVVDIPVCGACFEKGDLLEGMIDLDHHHASHPIGLA
ncbi:MAG TPA: hypothetical protein PLK94_01180 [Alphaproteobacteria bacterium]|nr:hypothetical protein [Alphaproteobacteria bacterium]